MDEKILNLIRELAEKVEHNSDAINILEDGLIEEIISAGYNFSLEEKNEITNKYMELLSHLKGKEDRKAISLYLKVLLENIIYIQNEQCKWDEKCKALSEQKKQAAEKRPVKVKMDVRELFAHQNKSVSDFAYNRLDTVVRYLAIENYYGKNDFGFMLYEKMQNARMGQGYAPGSIEKYKELIASFDKNGYDGDSCITCDQNLKLVDGSHRLALCLYHGIPEISIQLMPQATNIEYGIEWFGKNGFTSEEIEVICEKCIELLEQSIVPFTCILWPPVQEYFDEITELLASAYEVVSCEDFEYKEETFARMVRGVYHIDDIEAWKIEKKLSYMAAHSPKKVRLLKLYFIGADFRLKQMNGKTLSKVGEHIKRVIRSDYQGKVDNYFYDIIVHTGDNYRQNEFISKLFETAFSLSDYLDSIKDFKYVLTKVDAPYQTDDFPNTYAFSKDLDILVMPEEYPQFIEYTINYLQENVFGYELVGLESDNNYRIRIELNGYLIFQLDISKKIDNLSEEFFEKCVNERHALNGYFATSKENEVCIRINELMKNPNKQHHWEYLKENRNSIDATNLKILFGNIAEDIVIKIGEV